MDTKSSIRERRAERIRRIMEENRHAKPQQPLPQLKALPGSQRPQQYQLDYQQQDQQQQQKSHPLQNNKLQALPAKTAEASYEQTPQNEYDDPEQLWKANPNPWESAGWRIAPLPSKYDRDGKSGGPKAPQPPQQRFAFVIRGLFIQSAISVALFIIVFGMFKLDVPIAKKGQEVVTAALTEQMDFDAAARLYKDMFAGAPSFIPLFGSHDDPKTQVTEGAVELPIVAPLINGSVVRSFAETLSGVEIVGQPSQEVLTAETGRVINVTNDGETGVTVVIQHANNRVTVYGHLGEVKVAVNDWLEAGTKLGQLPAAQEGQQSLLFFAVKEKGKYVNPADVVPLD
ncbi:M23 family metallopeptidase [Paenibacillus sp. OV219]|uniref:M23 family metallopeptidase n=1 Tax=Paenibacillus sp. OV219 TaxID=1884377 RepID=UPI0008CFBC6F|nr:M23 family metallopeptidase [Paenibacillus sp. OV219]SEM67583.1 stage IV sporulation protein FA [Paenibacillus sp. OV219]